MQQLGRYIINTLDIRTYMIRDCLTDVIYLLLINPISGPHENVQITIAEVANSSKYSAHPYVEFVKETFSFKEFVSDWEQVRYQVSDIFAYINSYVDIANPVELAAMYGGELHGRLPVWPTPNYIELH